MYILLCYAVNALDLTLDFVRIFMLELQLGSVIGELCVYLYACLQVCVLCVRLCCCVFV